MKISEKVQKYINPNYKSQKELNDKQLDSLLSIGVGMEKEFIKLLQSIDLSKYDSSTHLNKIVLVFERLGTHLEILINNLFQAQNHPDKRLEKEINDVLATFVKLAREKSCFFTQYELMIKIMKFGNCQMTQLAMQCYLYGFFSYEGREI